MQNQKVCSLCEIVKPFSEFPKGNALFNLSSWCKACWKIYRSKHPDNRPEYKRLQYLNSKKNFPWINSYKNAEQRCNNLKSKDYENYGGRGIRFFLTKDETNFLWNRDKAFEMEQPSIDRINDDSHYDISNCRFIEFGENTRNNAITMPRNSKGIFIKRLRSK
jgi:hypothetical protein